MSLNDSSWSQASLPIQAAGRARHHEFCHLATSAFLASAAGSSSTAQQILPSSVAISSCPFKEEALSLWSQRKESGAWISAPPMSSLGLRMHGQ